MLTRIQLSIKLIKEATADLWRKIAEVKKKEQEIISEINKQKDEEEINKIKQELGI